MKDNKIFVNIIVDISSEAVARPFIYYADSKENEELNNIKVGSKVQIPFGNGNKIIEGFVIGFVKKEEINFPIEKIKGIIGLAKAKIGLNDILIEMAIFLSKEYTTPLPICLNTVLPVKKVVRKNSRQKDVSKKYEIDINLKDDINEVGISDNKKNEIVKASLEKPTLNYEQKKNS